MKPRPILAALAIAAGAWTLILGTVVVVHLIRFVDVFVVTAGAVLARRSLPPTRSMSACA